MILKTDQLNIWSVLLQYNHVYMSQNKTQPTNVSVDSFLTTVSEERRNESHILIDMMQEISGEKPMMWGPSIVGFGSYHYKYASGRTGGAAKIGFSPRKQAISLYITCDAESEFSDELSKLGSGVSYGKGCIYIKRLDGVNMQMLGQMIEKAYKASGDYDASNDK